MSKVRNSQLEKLNLFATGVDIGSRYHFIAIPAELCDENIREFRTFTEDLQSAIDWLKLHKITTVAMESTGIYWINFYDMLEQNGFEVLLVTTRHVKNDLVEGVMYWIANGCSNYIHMDYCEGLFALVRKSVHYVVTCATEKTWLKT